MYSLRRARPIAAAKSVPTICPGVSLGRTIASRKRNAIARTMTPMRWNHFSPTSSSTRDIPGVGAAVRGATLPGASAGAGAGAGAAAGAVGRPGGGSAGARGAGGTEGAGGGATGGYPGYGYCAAGSIGGRPACCSTRTRRCSIAACRTSIW
ncbi:MAG: hypothetical protein A3K65_07020 [Euryarchaeota archaeon RBG_16_68_12]|nr:MAG: hypothetical protein A3K65_07020 [Euryarchaeota archaeon RBG_16_68_12]